MANNYLITGYWGEPHVTAENDRGINAAMFGAGRFVLPVGEKFRAEYIGNNTIRMYDGKLMDNGAAAGIPAGEYVDLMIAETGQGMHRNDLIVFQYSQDASTLIESGTFIVIKGTETSGSATDPTLTEQDLLSGKATFDQMALWRVSVSGATISAPVQLFTLYSSKHNHSANDITSGTLPVKRGGTGASTVAGALENLGLTVSADDFVTVSGMGVYGSGLYLVRYAVSDIYRLTGIFYYTPALEYNYHVITSATFGGLFYTDNTSGSSLPATPCTYTLVYGGSGNPDTFRLFTLKHSDDTFTEQKVSVQIRKLF